MQYFGNIESSFQLSELTNASITASPFAIEIEDKSDINKRIVIFYENRKIKPATATNNNEDRIKLTALYVTFGYFENDYIEKITYYV